MRPPRRILIGAASYADARVALRLARRITARSHMVVGGLLVEEEILKNLPRLAGQRIVTATGALRDVPTAQQVARMIERDAKAFQTALSEFAMAAAPLERRRGELAVSVWDAAREWDVLVFGQRAIHGVRGRIVLIAPPAGNVSNAAALAEDLARATGTTILSFGLGPETGDRVDETFPTDAAMFARMERLDCAAVVLDRAAGPIHTVGQLRELLVAARCPVVLVGQATEAAAAAPPPK